MRFSRFLAPILGALILTVLVSPAAKPDAFDKKTVVTFDQDVEIPGWTLPAGTYVFKLVRSLSDRNIVQVWDGNEMQLYATLHTVSKVTLVTPDRASLLMIGITTKVCRHFCRAGSTLATTQAGLFFIPKIRDSHPITTHL